MIATRLANAGYAVAIHAHRSVADAQALVEEFPAPADGRFL